MTERNANPGAGTAPALSQLRNGEETAWTNPSRLPSRDALPRLPLTAADVADASARLRRFAPLIAAGFPDTRDAGGIIESPLTELAPMRALLAEQADAPLARVFLKRDSDLPVAGSIKARGGVYEVLKAAEAIALSRGLLTEGASYECLLSPQSRRVFSEYRLQVASTGNLGLSVGTMATALGFTTSVHMSADAKQWKKDLLRKRGAAVIEYPGDYSSAIAAARAASDADPMSHFVDDEHSADLFLGYAVAAERLQRQLCDAGVAVDAAHPLCVYIPCGVGGGPGGVCFGLKLLFGDAVRVYFVEPTEAPCVLLSLLTGRGSGISVQDIGLSGRTAADGLAVSRASQLVCDMMTTLLDGACTVRDERLLPYLRELWRREGLFIEPSSCAAFHGLVSFAADAPKQAAHIVWATGGRLVPEDVRREYLGSDQFDP